MESYGSKVDSYGSKVVSTAKGDSGCHIPLASLFPSLYNAEHVAVVYDGVNS